MIIEVTANEHRPKPHPLPEFTFSAGMKWNGMKPRPIDCVLH